MFSLVYKEFQSFDFLKDRRESFEESMEKEDSFDHAKIHTDFLLSANMTLVVLLMVYWILKAFQQCFSEEVETRDRPTLAEETERPEDSETIAATNFEKNLSIESPLIALELEETVEDVTFEDVENIEEELLCLVEEIMFQNEIKEFDVEVDVDEPAVCVESINTEKKFEAKYSTDEAFTSSDDKAQPPKNFLNINIENVKQKSGMLHGKQQPSSGKSEQKKSLIPVRTENLKTKFEDKESSC